MIYALTYYTVVRPSHRRLLRCQAPCDNNIVYHNWHRLFKVANSVNLDLPNARCLTESATKSKKIVSEYDQEIPQSQTADNPVAPRGRAAQPSQDTRKTN